MKGESKCYNNHQPQCNVLNSLRLEYLHSAVTGHTFIDKGPHSIPKQLSVPLDGEG